MADWHLVHLVNPVAVLLSKSHDAIHHPPGCEQEQRGYDVNHPARERMKEAVSHARAIIVRQHTRAADAQRIGKNCYWHRGDHQDQRAPNCEASQKTKPASLGAWISGWPVVVIII